MVIRKRHVVEQKKNQLQIDKSLGAQYYGVDIFFTILTFSFSACELKNKLFSHWLHVGQIKLLIWMDKYLLQVNTGVSNEMHLNW